MIESFDYNNDANSDDNDKLKRVIETLNDLSLGIGSEAIEALAQRSLTPKKDRHTIHRRMEISKFDLYSKTVCTEQFIRSYPNIMKSEPKVVCCNLILKDGVYKRCAKHTKHCCLDCSFFYNHGFFGWCKSCMYNHSSAKGLHNRLIAIRRFYSDFHPRHSKKDSNDSE